MATPSTSTPPVIEARGLTKDYLGRRVVDDLTLSIPRGEVFGLLGPNGAGKTTTILMMLGLVEPSTGSMAVLGLDPRRNPIEVKRRVGYVPDAVGFYDTMTGRENLRFTARLNGIDPTSPRIDEVLDAVGLTEAADNAAGTYSRGMKQRLGIADALVKRPEVLILDEPTTAIDPEGVAELLGLIRTLADDEGVTILLSSHLLHQVQAVCDRVAIFVRGRIAAIGAPAELATAHTGPQHLEVRIDGSPAAASSALTASDQVVSHEPGRRPGTWNVTVANGAAAALVADLVGRGLGVSSVRHLDDDLDAVYRRYFDANPVEAAR